MGKHAGSNSSVPLHSAAQTGGGAQASGNPVSGTPEVRDMFATIAPRYDLTNTVLSFGIHHWWRRRLLGLAQVAPGQHVLDCATGTGDVAIALKKKVGARGHVLATDFCAEMLAFAPEKARAKGLEIDFEQADAMDLPYEQGRFDCATISFGIRNVPDPRRCLSEMARVVRPGGKVAVLEFGQPDGLLFGPLYRFYSERVLPRIGGVLTGNHDAYDYLNRTSSNFPCGEGFAKIMDDADAFAARSATALSFGIAWVYVGEVR